MNKGIITNIDTDEENLYITASFTYPHKVMSEEFLNDFLAKRQDFYGAMVDSSIYGRVTITFTPTEDGFKIEKEINEN